MTEQQNHNGIPDLIGRYAAPADQMMPDAVLAADRVLAGIQLSAKAEERSRHAIDSKTGLLNGEPWLENLSQAVNTLEEGDVLSVTVGDVNGFKPVNDELGHKVGDELLAIIGQTYEEVYQRSSDTLARGSRETDDNADSAARLSGDEFGVMAVTKASDAQKRRMDPLEGAKTQAKLLNERLKEKLHGTKFEKYGISISSGTAVFEPGDTAETVFARADTAMYEAKYRFKAEKITDDDRQELTRAIPIFDKIGVRVPAWLRSAVLEQSSDT